MSKSKTSRPEDRDPTFQDERRQERRKALNQQRKRHLTRKLERGMTYGFNAALKEAKHHQYELERPLGYFQFRVNSDLDGIPIIRPTWCERWLTNEFRKRGISAHFSLSFDYTPRWNHPHIRDLYGMIYIELT